MRSADFFKDISTLTKEELEEFCIVAPLDGEGRVVLSSDYWDEVDGICYLKKPLKVDSLEWCLYTVGCSSVIAGIFDPDFVYVFVFSKNAEAVQKLSESYQKNNLWYLGYDHIIGFTRDEVDANAID